MPLMVLLGVLAVEMHRDATSSGKSSQVEPRAPKCLFFPLALLATDSMPISHATFSLSVTGGSEDHSVAKAIPAC